MKRIALAIGLVIGGVIAVLATSASSNGPPLRDINGKPITPGYVVSELHRDADGICRPSPGQDIGIGGKAHPGEAGSVTLHVDQATCKVVVARVDTATPDDPPTGHITESGGR